MLDVHRLRLLRELDRLGTLAAVARALSYSPSAVSQQLSQLEAETGVALLEPAGRSVRLTAQARILVAHAEAILERLEEAEADLRASLTEVRAPCALPHSSRCCSPWCPRSLRRSPAGTRGSASRSRTRTRRRRSPASSPRDLDVVLGEEYPSGARPPVPGARTRLLASDELFLVLPAHGPYARAERRQCPSACPTSQKSPGSSTRRTPRPGSGPATLAARRASNRTCAIPGRTCCFRFTWPRRGTPPRSSPVCCSPWSRPRRPAFRALPGHPRRKLTTGVRSGATADPAIRAFRAALSEAIHATGSHAAAELN
jgi:DNA-binding transcriptional LysR family regulator